MKEEKNARVARLFEAKAVYLLVEYPTSTLCKTIIKVSFFYIIKKFYNQYNISWKRGILFVRKLSLPKKKKKNRLYFSIDSTTVVGSNSISGSFYR